MQTKTRVWFGVLVVVGSMASGCGSSSESSLRPPATTSTPPKTSPTASPAVTRPGAAMLPSPYQPLWPFTDARQVEAWKESYRASGKDPWHLNADQTALIFAQSFLGFREVDRVISRKVTGGDAHLAVGYPSPESGRPAKVAVIHLLKAGKGGDAPWEVVGTDDTDDFSLTTPVYGAAAGSPVKVGGRISGVDESIRVHVRQPSGGKPLGEYCCLSAGGEKSPWSASVTFRGATDPVLTIVAWTGGHVAEVERFAVTGVRR